MNSREIELNVKRMMENFSKENFLFDLLLAYGISKTSITRLKSGDFNLSKVDGEILYKKKIFFKQQQTEKLLSSIEIFAKEERILKHSPRFSLVTDYKNLVAKDLKLGKNLDISIIDLPNHYAFFLPLAGSEVYHSTNDNEADRNAAYKMAQLYDLLITQNPSVYNSKEGIHNLNIFLSRLLFCFFAEDTEIFDGDSIFTNTLYQHTNENGSDTHLFLDRLFDRLNTENAKGFPAHLVQFPYVNGGLFRDKIASPVFTAKARKILVELGELNWRDINPDIFGSMIQAVVIPEYRSDLGMHYTSIPNIQKLIKPLFLDALYEEFENCKTIPQLRKLINRIAKMKFFDPACGSGNFLIITYKEIRLLEVKILQRIIDLSPTPAMEFTSIQLSQFYGIELDDFAHEMAILSLWLAEHQMNRVFEEMLFDYGKSKPILPLKQAGKIVQGNAARVDWKTVCPIGKEDEVYVIGNPPYLGSRNQVEEQKEDMKFVFRDDYKSLDYVSIWFYKGAKYIEGHNAQLAFVSTNSVCQGLLVSLTWPRILNEYIEIGFAYQSFKWTNNAKGNAGVTVIILGLRNKSAKPKYLFFDKLKKEAKNINAYLLDSEDIYIFGRTKPLAKFPEMLFGNMPNDGGNLLFEEPEFKTFIAKYPTDAEYVKKYVGGSDFINGEIRYTLFVSDAEKEKAEKNSEIAQRFKKVYGHRIKSTERSTREKAKTPNQFYFSGHKETDSIIVPRTSSERREYIPLGFLTNETIIADSAMAIYDAQPWLFGVIHSKMHMVWVNAVGGKLKTDYRYSAKLCYNTFPFPDITLKQKENLNLYVFAILDERAKHPEKTMAQLYDPDKMAKEFKGLKQAHEELNRAVEQCYRLQPFASDTERLEYLFKLYAEMTKSGTLFEKQKKTIKTTASAKK
ncbi:MAG: DNA methyltransferase [Sphingobacteriales bacterium]|jgi:hypothetical protein